MKVENNEFSTTVHRKPTYIPSVITANSFYPKQHKFAVYVFVNHVISHCSSKDGFSKEIHLVYYIAKTFAL